MSQLVISRIANILQKQFAGRIDMSDWAGRPEGDARKAFLSRALAAQCVKTLSGADNETAGRSVVDGFDDNGVDAIFFDQTTDRLILVQSKWSENGNRPIDADGAGALVTGVTDLLALQMSRFNEKAKAKEADLRAALYLERPLRILIVTAHTATETIGAHAKRKIDDLVLSLNDGVPIAEDQHFNQAGIYSLITSESEPPKLTLQVGLKNWGVVDRPFQAFYGRVHVSEIAEWWKVHGNSLFVQNLRLFYSNSEVNSALRQTLISDPESFWYFNNGITLICDRLNKAAAGAPGREVGIFTCFGASVVNGAQTVGTIGTTFRDRTQPENADETLGPWAQVRIISLEDCPPEFSKAITRAANLQNAVGNREFAAMDPNQHRLATEFALDRRKYVYKQGEPDPKGEEGCSIVEATQALACAHSMELAVQSKREIGALWADTQSAPYKELFNDQLSGTMLWRSVLLMRAADDAMQKLRNSTAPRADMVATHVNRAVLHLVFQDPALAQRKASSMTEAALVDVADRVTRALFPRVADYIQTWHPNDYLASLAKNNTKCQAMAATLRRQTGTSRIHEQESLDFDKPR